MAEKAAALPASRRSSPPAARRAAAQPERPARAPRAEEPRARSRGRQPVDEDPGLLLITRRPPKQKFANFEEYIAAHGGVTVPVEDGGTDVPADPQPPAALPEEE